MSKILFNGLQYDKNNGAGISNYTHMVLREFEKSKYNVDMIIRSEVKKEYTSNKFIYSNNKLNTSKDRILYEQFKSLKLYKNYDLIHFADYATPVFYRGKKVATIHDMAMYSMRDKYTKSQAMTKDILMKNTIKNSDKLICISEFTKKELLKYYPEAEEKSIVIHSGIEIPKMNIKDDIKEKVLNKYRLEKENYILYVGTIAPQKNIDNLIKGYEKAKKEGIYCKLVIVGKKGWMYEEIFKYVVENKLEEDIIFTGYVSEVELEVLYRNAKIFSTISLYEGFGFPPLEAIGRGIPVLLSDIEIFKEICDDSALYCNPHDIKDISEKMIDLTINKNLQDDLKIKGEKVIEKFKWGKTVNEIYNVYSELLK